MEHSANDYGEEVAGGSNQTPIAAEGPRVCQNCQMMIDAMEEASDAAEAVANVLNALSLKIAVVSANPDTLRVPEIAWRLAFLVDVAGTRVHNLQRALSVSSSDAARKNAAPNAGWASYKASVRIANAGKRTRIGSDPNWTKTRERDGRTSDS